MPSTKPSSAFAARRNPSTGCNLSARFHFRHEVNETHSDVVNRALAEIVRRWRTCGLTLQEAQYQADQFARHFTQAAVR